MANPELTAEVLLNLGFVDVGRWQPSGDFIAYHLDGDDAAANEVLLDAPNALYAFVKGDEVLYIGKTARSVRKRYVGYCRARQATGDQPALSQKNQIGDRPRHRDPHLGLRADHISDMRISRSTWPLGSRTA